MGCVFSQEEKKDYHRPRGKQAPVSRVGQPQTVRTESSQKSVPLDLSVIQTPNTTGVLSNNNQSQKANEPDDADTPFRRQHFDRNSMLRHSKKRKKSSVSSNALGNNSTVMNSSACDLNASVPDQPTTILPDTIQIFVPDLVVDNSVQKMPIDLEESVLTDNLVLENLQSVNELRKPLEEDKDKSFDEMNGSSSDHLSASARVAALLSGTTLITTTNPPVFSNPVERALEEMSNAFESEYLNGSSFNDDEEPPLAPPSPDIFDTQSFEQLQESPVVSPNQQRYHANKLNGHDLGLQQHHLITSTPLAKVSSSAAKSISTPSRIPKLMSGSSVGGAHIKVTKTPSNGENSGIPKGIRTPNGGSGRLVLRTRRQVAHELEEQERSKSSNIDGHEDCGRLI